MVRNNNCYNINVRHDSQMYASPSDDEYDEAPKSNNSRKTTLDILNAALDIVDDDAEKESAL